MDLERVAIKTLYYDYPIEMAVKMLSKKENSFLDVFSRLAKWRDTAFTVTEWKLLRELLEKDWLSPLSTDSPDIGIGNSLKLLRHVSNRLLVLDHNRIPCVKFDQLFRWRDITLMVGEDTLTLAYLAQRDVVENCSSSAFLWPDILQHDNKALNILLNEGVSDVHAHFNATADIFHVNWISMVNGSALSYVERYFDHTNEQLLDVSGIEHIYQFNNICVAASYLRILLFYLNKGIAAPDDFVWQDVECILADNDICEQKRERIKDVVGALSSTALKMAWPRMFDYAIECVDSVLESVDNAYVAYYGERKLLYDFFVKYYRGEHDHLAASSYMYLYLLLKTRIRREIVETNILHGFENFEDYQDRKACLMQDSTPLQYAATRLVVQGTLRPTKDDYLEARIVPWSIDKYLNANKLNRGLFSGEKVIDNIANKLAFVVHFIKPDEQNISNGAIRYETYRCKIKEDIDKILHTYHVQGQNDPDTPKLVGIDAAGSEFKCRPEVYAHVFRYAEKRGLLGRTYHAGEDFYDLVDGLRAIDEAILFLHLTSDSRIGHALALSINPQLYYESRHCNVIISKQAMLDNCVWLYFRIKDFDLEGMCKSSLLEFLHETAMSLYDEIGYKGRMGVDSEFNILRYRHSMLLRGDEFDTLGGKDPAWDATNQLNVEDSDMLYTSIKAAHVDVVAKKLYEVYLKDSSVQSNGRQVCAQKYPPSIISVVYAIQQAMIRQISEKRIAIECCPSSNLKIGHFNRYDEHPIFTFRPIEPKATDPILNVSINTDDRGVFATSLYNEYSLIALAMTKMKDENGHAKYNEEHILDYIERIRQNGFTQRFR